MVLNYYLILYTIHMKRLLIIVLICTGLSQFPDSFCQTVTYTYDDVGNMIVRGVISLKSAQTDKGSLNAQEDDEFIDKTFTDKVVRIYPNPTRGFLEIEIPYNQDELPIIKITVTDLSGRVIIDKMAEQGRTSIDLSNSPNGMYLLTLKKGTVVSVWKVIKQ